MGSKMIKFSSILLIGVGTLSFIWGAYSYSIGFFAGEEVNLQSNSSTLIKEQIIPPKMTYNKPIEKGEKIGRLMIPKLELALPIFQGTDEDVLKQGVGHFIPSALPGEQNNVILSGHRDTVFRKLGKVGVGDEVIVATEVGEFLYKIKKVRIVDKDDRTVVVPKPKETLTLTTCYPFHYIGNAPQRYVLVAELISMK